MLESQKENIKKVFNVKLIEHYGLAEGVSNISENINGNFEIDQDFAYTELINNNNNERKIIGTNYSNIAFPLIRYDTGDVALVDENDNDKILSILGRVEDYIILPNGVKLGRLDHIFKDIKQFLIAFYYC